MISKQGGCCSLARLLIQSSRMVQGHRSQIHTNKTGDQKGGVGTSLVAQWLRIRLPMQGTQVRALV